MSNKTMKTKKGAKAQTKTAVSMTKKSMPINAKAAKKVYPAKKNFRVVSGR